jgi:hypothetical protein
MLARRRDLSKELKLIDFQNSALTCLESVAFPSFLPTQCSSYLSPGELVVNRTAAYGRGLSDQFARAIDRIAVGLPSGGLSN